jgi:hypothetical protein
MSITYTITTNFGSKDSLPTGDSNKIIKGSEFTTEFNAIKSAFVLAAPVANPTFTGTVTIPTAAVTTGNITTANVTTFTLGGTTITATGAELNYMDGVTSNVQTQLDAKAPLASPTFTGTVDVSGATLTLADNQISGDKVEGGTIAATTITDLTTTTVNIGDWDIKLDGSDLVFNYSGTDVFKITTAGATIALDDVTAFGTP